MSIAVPLKKAENQPESKELVEQHGAVETPGPPASSRRLDSWKEIATFLGRDPRTVQRWEKTENLPVHRHLHAKSGSVYAFAEELDLWRKGRTSPPLPVTASEAMIVPTKLLPEKGFSGRGRLGVPPFLAACGAAVAVAIAIGYLTIYMHQDRLVRGTPFTTLPGAEVSPSFSPDGRYVAFAWVDSSSTRAAIYVKPVSGGPERRLSWGATFDYSPAWSPNGKTIAYLRGSSLLDPGTIWLASLAGGLPKQVGSRRVNVWTSSRDLAWTPDGRALLVAGSDAAGDGPSALYLVPAEGGPERQITYPPTGSADHFPAVSDDGRDLVFTRFSHGISILYRTRLGEKDEIHPVFLPGSNSPSSIVSCWRPGRKELFVGAEHAGFGQLWRVPLAGKAELLMEVDGGIVDVAASRRGGDLLYSVSRSDVNIWTLALSGSGTLTPRRMDELSSTRDDYNAQYSPDGLRLAFESNRSGFPEVWISDRTGAGATALTHFHGPVTGSPHWAPDGRRLAFDSRVDGHAAIFVVNKDGGSLRRITPGDGPNVVPSWSHDGEWIYFGSGRTGKAQIWRMHPDGVGAAQITRAGGFAAQESADGQFIFYTKSRDTVTSLWRAAANGGNEVEVARPVLDRTFAMGRNGVYFASAVNPESQVSLQFLPYGSGAKPSIVTTLAHPIMYGLALSPDEHELMFGQLDGHGSDLVLVKSLSQ